MNTTTTQSVPEGMLIPDARGAMIVPETGMLWALCGEYGDTQEAAVNFAEATLGMIPDLVTARDKRPMAEQLNETYAHGGGWKPLDGYTLDENANLQFKGGEPRPLLAFARCNDEAMFVYDSAICVIAHRSGTFEVSRLD